MFFVLKQKQTIVTNIGGGSLLRLDALGWVMMMMHARKGREGSFYGDTNNKVLVFTSF